MIDLTAEQPLTLREATRLPFLRRHGRAPNLATLYRWAQRGLANIRLETIQVGGSRCTSEAALLRFFDRLTTGDVVERRTPFRRARDIEREEKELDEAKY